MSRPEDDQPETPRCPICGRWMQVADPGERIVTYECCGRTVAKARPEFEQATGMYAGAGRRRR